MKFFIDSGTSPGHRSAGAARHHRRRHDQSVAPREGERRSARDPQEDLRAREGAGQRRGRRDRRAGDDQGRPRARQDRSAHRRQGAAHARRHQGVQGAVGRRHPGQRHAVLLAGAGAARGQGRRDLHQPVRRPPRRHRDARHGADSRHRRDLRATTTSRPRSSSPARAARCTSSRPPAWAPTSAPARRR